MKGVLLCGGEGTRLRPLTEVVNKHLIRIKDKPMAEYPLLKMIDAGIKEFLIVSGGANFAGIVKYFGSGNKWGVSIVHAIQDQPGGIAQALSLAKDFTGDQDILVVLGDNFWDGDIKPFLNSFVELKDLELRSAKGALLFSTRVNNPQDYGVFRFDSNFRVVGLVEKPSNPDSKHIATGIYSYGPEVFEIIERCKPSARGELEITSVNSYYIKAGLARVVELPGAWYDCGQFDTLFKVEERILNDRSF